MICVPAKKKQKKIHHPHSQYKTSIFMGFIKRLARKRCLNTIEPSLITTALVLILKTTIIF